MTADLLNLYYIQKEQSIKDRESIMKTSSLDITYASEVEEFFYEGTSDPVPEGSPVGIEVDSEEGVELVLFSNIYWKNYHDAFWDNL